MTGRRHPKLVILAMLGILLLSATGVGACSYGGQSTPVTTTPAGGAATPVPIDQTPLPAGRPASIKADVTLSNFAFSPATVTIPVEATVIWTNKDSVTHTVTSDNGVFDSGSLALGKTFSYTFTQAGTFQYHCNIHPSMTGKITVGQ